MATRQEKVKIVLTAKDEASKTIQKTAAETKSLGSVTKGLIGPLAGVAAGYTAWRGATAFLTKAITQAADYEATLTSLRAVTDSTGRDMTQIMAELQKQTGGLATKAQLASGFLKGMTTELNVEQVAKLTTAIKDASIAMGEDFGTQFPLIIKAIKQLNPAILDNIGVTVRLDQVNKKIREGYYGLNTEINESTQQHAIFVEIMKQTAKFAGQEEQFLKSLKGQWVQLNTAITDATTDIGRSLTFIIKTFSDMTGGVDTFTDLAKESEEFAEKLAVVLVNIISVGRVTTNVATIVSRAMHMIVQSVVNVGGVLEALASAAKGDWAGVVLAMQPWKDSMDDLVKGIEGDIDDINDAMTTMQTVAVDVALWFDDIGKSAPANLDKVKQAATEAEKAVSTFGMSVHEALQIVQQSSQDSRDAAVEAMQDMRRELELMQYEGFEREKKQAELAYQDRLAQLQKFNDAKIFEDGEYRAARLDALRIYNDQVAEIEARAFAEQQARWMQNWMFIHNAVSNATQSFVQIAITDISQLGGATKKIFAQMGADIVHALVQRGVNAIYSFIAATVVQRSAETILQTVTKATTAATIAQTTAKLANNTVTASYGAIAAATIGVLRLERVAVDKLRDAYIAAASAKAALSLGLLTPAIVGAAAATKAGLDAILKGFDDPINDAIARRHGEDYADQFMKGAQQRFGSPTFGLDVTESISRRSTQPSGGGNTYVFNFHGPVTSEDWVQQEIIPAIEKSHRYRRTNIQVNRVN